MNRKDWIWVAIKVFGIYLGIEALQAIPPLASSFIAVNEASRGMVPLFHVAMLPAWQQFMTLFILVNLSLYFLRSGRIIYWLIGTRETPSQQ